MGFRGKAWTTPAGPAPAPDPKTAYENAVNAIANLNMRWKVAGPYADLASVVDEKGNDPLTVHGAAITADTDPLGNPAAAWDGTGSCLQDDGVDHWAGWTAFTLAFLVKFTSETTTMGILGRRDANYAAEAGAWSVQLVNGKVRWEPMGSGGTYLDIDSPNLYGDGAWHEVYVTYSSGANVLYVDGTEVNSGTQDTFEAFAHHLFIGGMSLYDSGTDYDRLTGSLGDIRIYNSTASPDQVLATAQALGLHA